MSENHQIGAPGSGANRVDEARRFVTEECGRDIADRDRRRSRESGFVLEVLHTALDHDLAQLRRKLRCADLASSIVERDEIDLVLAGQFVEESVDADLATSTCRMHAVG